MAVSLYVCMHTPRQYRISPKLFKRQPQLFRADLAKTAIDKSAEKNACQKLMCIQSKRVRKEVLSLPVVKIQELMMRKLEH